MKITPKTPQAVKRKIVAYRGTGSTCCYYVQQKNANRYVEFDTEKGTIQTFFGSVVNRPESYDPIYEGDFKLEIEA